MEFKVCAEDGTVSKLVPNRAQKAKLVEQMALPDGLVLCFDSIKSLTLPEIGPGLFITGTEGCTWPTKRGVSFVGISQHHNF